MLAVTIAVLAALDAGHDVEHLFELAIVCSPPPHHPRLGRAVGLADRHRDDSGRDRRARSGAHLPYPVRQTPAAAIFLTINGVILLVGERLRRIAPTDDDAADVSAGVDPQLDVAEKGPSMEGQHVAVPDAVKRRTRRLATLSYREAFVIGFFQTFALLAGISRSGISMVGGLARGLSHRDAARFAFLLATPVILAAGFLKLPTLAGPAGHGIYGQVLVGAIVAGLASYVSIKWLTRYFETAHSPRSRSTALLPG